jgi:hypothetical protein
MREYPLLLLVPVAVVAVLGAYRIAPMPTVPSCSPPAALR